MPGIVSVTVALQYANGKRKTTIVAPDGSTDSPSGGLLFHFYPTETVSSIRPYEGPVRGGTAIAIFGTGFRRTPDLAIRFQPLRSSTNGTDSIAAIAARVVPAHFVSNEELTVQTPRCPSGPVGGIFSVEVSSNGVDFSSSDEGPLYFYDASGPFVEKIAPVIVREGGGVVVHVHGSGFPETSPAALACSFGESTPVAARRHSAELLTCMAPSHQPGRVVVTVTSYGQSLASDDDLIVEFVGALRTLSLWPMLGPARGGTVVTVHGEGFRVDEEYLCEFGVSPTRVLATIINSSALECTTPALHHSQDALSPLVVRPNSIENSYETSIIGGVGPDASGTIEGGQLLAPLSFQYHADINIFEIRPVNGPASGGTVVRISGSGFLDLPQAACRFGMGKPTPARVIDNYTLVCTASSRTVAAAGTDRVHLLPTINVSRADSSVAVRVTVNTFDFSPPTPTVLFHYDEDIKIFALIPNRGPATGDIRVIVRGSGFRSGKQLACRFGTEVVAAAYVSTSTIMCTAPAQSRFSVVSVAVTLNGQDFAPASAVKKIVGPTAGPVFTYTSRAAVTAVQPEAGPTRGGTTVYVSGVNFANTTMVRCRFGGLQQTAAEFISPDMVTCTSPPVPVGTGRVYLEVSDPGMLGFLSGGTIGETGTLGGGNGGFLTEPGDDPALWTNSGVEFTFKEDVEVLAAFPSSGPSSGGTRVSLIGSGFEDVPGIGCRFGGVTLGEDGSLHQHMTARIRKTAMEVSALYVSPTEIMCLSPVQSSAQLGETQGVETVMVAFTLNGQDYGLRMARFTYYPTPKVRPEDHNEKTPAFRKVRQENRILQSCRWIRCPAGCLYPSSPPLSSSGLLVSTRTMEPVGVDPLHPENFLKISFAANLLF